MDKSDTSYVFYPTTLMKHSRPNFRGKPIKYKEYPMNKNLCVVQALNAYIARTNDLSMSPNLLLTHRKPYRPASKDTVARWLKEILADAGINNYTAHTFRHASTSVARNYAKLTIKDIMSQGQWTSSNTWFRHYNSDIINSNIHRDFGTSILDLSK